MSRFAAFRWAAVFFVVVTLILNGVGLLRIQQSMDSLSGTKRGGSIWFASQLEIEYLRFQNVLAHYALQDGTISARDVALRFDILWSRAGLALNGLEGMPAVKDPEANKAITALSHVLESQEDWISGLQEGDLSGVTAAMAAFRPLEEPIHSYMLTAKAEQAEQDAGARESLLLISRVMAMLSFAVGVASLIVVALFFIDSRRHRSVSAQNEALLAQSRAAYVAKSQFLSTVSHELRTPLTSIKGALGIMKGGVLGEMPARAQKLVHAAYDNTERLILLINDILDLEKSEAGQMSYSFRELDAGLLVRRAVDANRNYLVERGVQFVTNGCDAPNTIRGDEGRLMQVLGNLLSNAIKFSHRGGEVHVSVIRHEMLLEVAVRDFGIGISEEFLGSVFDKFTQEDSSDTRKAGGTGLGLSIAQRIVQDHGGRIEIESRRGEGSTFRVLLPLPQAG